MLRRRAAAEPMSRGGGRPFAGRTADAPERTREPADSDSSAGDRRPGAGGRASLVHGRSGSPPRALRARLLAYILRSASRRSVSTAPGPGCSVPVLAESAGMPSAAVRACDGGLDLAGHLVRTLLARAGHEDDELVAAVAGDHIRPRQRARRSAGEIDEKVVARLVAAVSLTSFMPSTSRNRTLDRAAVAAQVVDDADRAIPGNCGCTRRSDRRARRCDPSPASAGDCRELWWRGSPACGAPPCPHPRSAEAQ